MWEKGSGTPPYESWADAARDIQSALDVSGSGDRIVVEAGTYGAVTVSNAVYLMGYRGAAETVIDGGGSERAVTMSGGGTLEGFTIRNGASEDCGGILADGGVTVRDVVVEGCRAMGNGGGVCLYGGSIAENVTASGNAAAYGAGFYATATSAVVRCGIDGNAASVRDGDYHLRAGSPCVDTGENQPWMAEACDFDGQRRVEIGEEGDGRDIWVDVGTDEAALDAVEMPSAGRPFWTWRVVLDANLRLQHAAGLLEGTVWEDVNEPFTATEQTWTLDEPFDGTGMKFYRLIWRKE